MDGKKTTKYKILILLFIITATVHSRDKRTHVIRNESSFPVLATITRKAKICREKEKQWIIQPKESKTISSNRCKPTRLTISFPDHKAMKFTILSDSFMKVTGSGAFWLPLKTRVKKMPRYWYWSVIIKGEKSPLTVKASSYALAGRLKETFGRNR